ncbi:MAG: PHP domain-containing protein [Neisseriaceae bacterium]|nr:MAG: PHP domain-containing protein [Neisseriaceae bacterium]
MQIDLHFHSNFSDGIYTPKELIERANENHAELLALTDHDNIGGLEEARIVSDKLGIAFVNGVEISVTWRNKVIHVIGLDFDLDYLPLIRLIDEIRSVRLKRLSLISEKLENIGIRGVYQGALELSSHPDTVGRRHMAEYLVSQGVVSSIQQAFNKYLGEGKKGYVKTEWGSLQEVVRLIVEAGGIAVLAHPLRYNLTLAKIRQFLDEFIVYGGQGIEVGCSGHDYNEIMTVSLLAEQYNLLASSGSDFHGHEYGCHRKIGVTPDLPIECRPIWDVFKFN